MKLKCRRTKFWPILTFGLFTFDEVWPRLLYNCDSSSRHTLWGFKNNKCVRHLPRLAFVPIFIKMDATTPKQNHDAMSGSPQAKNIKHIILRLNWIFILGESDVSRSWKSPRTGILCCHNSTLRRWSYIFTVDKLALFTTPIYTQSLTQNPLFAYGFNNLFLISRELVYNIIKVTRQYSIYYGLNVVL